MDSKTEREEVSKLELGLVNGRYRALVFLVEKTKIDNAKPFHFTASRLLEVIKLGLRDIDVCVKTNGKFIDCEEVTRELMILDKLYNLLINKMKG